MVRLYHPRQDPWHEHFRVHDDFHLLGLSSPGRATVALLHMNRPLAVDLRREEAARNRYS